jgi:hypothetical protein
LLVSVYKLCPVLTASTAQGDDAVSDGPRPNRRCTDKRTGGPSSFEASGWTASRLVGAEVNGDNSALPRPLASAKIKARRISRRHRIELQEPKDGCSIDIAADTSFQGSAFCSRQVVEKWALVSTNFEEF